MYRDVRERETDDFCPRARLNKLVKACGNVVLARKQNSANHIVLYDANNTWQKITSQLPELVNDVCGKDLEETATQYAEGACVPEEG